jgi:rhodanese-related sulfurtransferase
MVGIQGVKGSQPCFKERQFAGPMISGVPRPIKFIEPAVQEAFPRHPKKPLDPLNVVVPARAKRWDHVRPVIDAGPKYQAKHFNKKFIKGEMFHRVTADTLHYAIQRMDSKFLILDAREKDEYDEAHILGAVSYPQSMVTRGANELTPEIRAYRNMDGKLIVVYENNERAAKRVANILANQKGIENVSVLNGGLDLFAKAYPNQIEASTGRMSRSSSMSSRSTISNTPQRKAAPADASCKKIDADTFATICGSSKYLVADVREREAYELCHIKGAVHYPLTMLTRSANEFLPQILAYRNKQHAKIVLYSDEEKNALRAAQILYSQKGFDNLLLLSRGLKQFAKQHPHLLVGDAPLEEQPIDTLARPDSRSCRLDTRSTSSTISISSSRSVDSDGFYVPSRGSSALGMRDEINRLSTEPCGKIDASTLYRAPGGKYLVLDIRDPDDYQRCKVRGALNFPSRMLCRTQNDLLPEMITMRNAPHRYLVLYGNDTKQAEQVGMALYSNKNFNNVLVLARGLRGLIDDFPDLIDGKPPAFL